MEGRCKAPAQAEQSPPRRLSMAILVKPSRHFAQRFLPTCASLPLPGCAFAPTLSSEASTVWSLRRPPDLRTPACMIIHAGSFRISKRADLSMSAGHDVVAKDSAVVRHPVIRQTMAHARVDDTPTPQWAAKRRQLQAHWPPPDNRHAADGDIQATETWASGYHRVAEFPSMWTRVT